MRLRMRAVFIFTAFAMAIVVVGCGTKTGEKEEINISGINPANFDTTCAPCTDFYQYANGNWLKNNPIPPEYSSWTAWHEVYERNAKILHEVLEDAASKTSAPKGSITQQIGDLFYTAMDTNAIEVAGITPLKNDFERIQNLKSKKDLEKLISDYHAEGLQILFDVGSNQDMIDNTQVILYATQGGLSLPDRDYYTKTDDESVKLRQQYVDHVARMLQMTGESEADAKAHAQVVLDMETRLAKASLTNVELRDPMKWYNIVNVSKANKKTPNFNWSAYLKTIGVGDITSFSYAQPSFFKEMNKMLADMPLDNWKAYVKWHVLTANAPFLDSSFVKEDFHFFSSVLYGTEKMRPRWKRVLGVSNRFLGEAIGQLYVKKAFPPEYKRRALEMVKNLQAALKERIQKLTWMGEETKKKALEKLDAFTLKIGYPDKWKDYSKLEIGRDSYVQNIRNARAFKFHQDIDKIGKPVDKTEWGMSPQTINAYYSPQMNEVVFPAGILQPPFFDGKIDDAVNYGAIGAVIGHEMTHGFDDQGRQFDASGNFNNWWTDEDAKNFKTRAQKLVEQFDNYIAVDSLHVNGKLTLGENIADLGGVTISFYALKKALAGKPEEKIDGFTPEQRFFLSFAQIWRNNVKPEAMKVQINTDPHSPGRFRVNGPLSNFEEFRKAFGCSEGDPMVRSGDKQIVIW